MVSSHACSSETSRWELCYPRRRNGIKRTSIRSVSSTFERALHMPPRQIDRETAPDFSQRIPQLDGLRGVAIAIVVLFYYVNAAFAAGAPRFVAVLLRPTSLGWSGVDLFFILSGFLIGGILR